MMIKLLTFLYPGKVKLKSPWELWKKKLAPQGRNQWYWTALLHNKTQTQSPHSLPNEKQKCTEIFIYHRELQKEKINSWHFQYQSWTEEKANKYKGQKH